MKTLSEAALKMEKDQEFWQRNRDLVTEISNDISILKCLLTISTQNKASQSVMLIQAMAVGISIGMEMEKP